jgi:endonuclease/exonuclease/phosphatase family metal-dependent hydrolase
MKIFGRTVGIGACVIVVAGLLGQFVRDRWVVTAILMYLPLLPVAMAAIVFDAFQKGRALRPGRFLLTSIGVLASACAVVPMIGSGEVGNYGPTDREVTLLQWNVLWGGGPWRSAQTWAAQRTEIIKRDPDIIILSELPPVDWIDKFVDGVGPGANIVSLEHDASSRYWYRLGVCSRWPLLREQTIPLPDGVGMSVTVSVPGRPLRLLVVDGKSNPFHSRLPFLRAVANLCRGAARAGRPFDVVAGDFNTPSHSIGFDAMADQRYTLAGRATHGWRGTFPSALPIYDIDHVWSGPDLRLRSCAFFNGPYSDHRGQFVSLLWSETADMTASPGR